MKMLLTLLSLLVITPNLVMAANRADSADGVGFKCEIYYSRVEASDRPYKTVIDIPIVRKSVSGSGTLYNFDRLQSLEIMGRPDLFVWVKGNYFHYNAQPVNSYVRFNTTLCEKGPGEEKANCESSDYSGDVFAEVIQQKTIYHGKKVQMKGTYLLEKENLAMNTMANFRIEHGHDMTDDIDMSTSEGHLKYLQILGPQVVVTCSIQDDAFGVVSAY